MGEGLRGWEEYKKGRGDLGGGGRGGKKGWVGPREENRQGWWGFEGDFEPDPIFGICTVGEGGGGGPRLNSLERDQRKRKGKGNFPKRDSLPQRDPPSPRTPHPTRSEDPEFF